MAVIKAKFVPRGRGERTRAKKTIRYIQHRPEQKGARTTRLLFGTDGALERGDAYRMIDEAGRGTVFFRVVISPDPLREDPGKDLDLLTLTTHTMLSLEERIHQPVHFIAAMHEEHSRCRHVHALVLIRGRLTKADIASLHQAATDAALFQRRERNLALIRAPQASRAPWQKGERSMQAKPTIAIKTCPTCGTMQLHAPQESNRCDACGARLLRKHAYGQTEEAQWE